MSARPRVALHTHTLAPAPRRPASPRLTHGRGEGLRRLGRAEHHHVAALRRAARPHAPHRLPCASRPSSCASRSRPRPGRRLRCRAPAGAFSLLPVHVDSLFDGSAGGAGYAGVAKGVGESKILGRVHAAPMQIGSFHMTVRAPRRARAHTHTHTHTSDPGATRQHGHWTAAGCYTSLHVHARGGGRTGIDHGAGAELDGVPARPRQLAAPPGTTFAQPLLPARSRQLEARSGGVG